MKEQDCGPGYTTLLWVLLKITQLYVKMGEFYGI